MRPELTRARWLLAALSATMLPCPAQDGDPKTSVFDLIPANTHIVISIGGPAALAEKFAGTRAMKLFGSDAFAKVLRKHWQPMERTLKKKLDEHSFDLDTLLGQLHDYRGDIVVTWHLGDKAIDFSAPPRQVTFTVLLGPDDNLPLQKLCDNVAEAIKETQGDRVEELEFEGRRFFRMQTGRRGRNHLLLPFMHRQHLCLMVCNDPQAALRRLLNPEQKPTYRPQAPLADKAMFADVNLQSLMALMRRSLQRLDENEDSEWNSLFDDLGGRCLERLQLMVAARPPYLVYEIRLQLNNRNLGLLSALFPEQPGTSPLGTMLPGDIQSAATFYLSLPRLHAAAEQALEGRTDLPFRFSSLGEQFESVFELRLKEDVLAHVGGHVLLMEHATMDREDVDEGDLFNPVAELVRELSPYCLAVSLEDAGAFGNSLERMLRKRGLHAARKTRDYKAFKMREVNLAGVPLHYTVTSRALLLALGDGGGLRAMRSALDCESRVVKGEPGPGLRRDVEERVAIEPDPRYGIGYDDLMGLLATGRQEYDRARKMVEEYYEGGLEEAMREDTSLRLWMPLVDALLDFGDLLRPFDLGTQAAVVRYQGRRIVQRLIW